LDRIAAFVPLPHRHRRHYHGVFAPNSPLRKKVVVYAQQRIGPTIAVHIQKVVTKTRRVSLDWAQLIKRIYEINPLICTGCGRTIKIRGFVTHQAEINRILRNIGWPIKFHEFDSPYDIPNGDVCQLIRGTEDGFPSIEGETQCDIGPDPPLQESYSDPPYWENNCDPPHWEETIDPPHWSE
jgi:hypothetical protein